MLKKIKIKFDNMKAEYRKRIVDRASKDRVEDAAREYLREFQLEKEALMELTERGLMIEGIMELRGCNLQLSNIKEKLDTLVYRVDSLEWTVDSLDSNISKIESSIDGLKCK